MQTMVPLYGFGGVPYSAVRKAAPRNLLDNSDFRNPVNQAGVNGLHGTKAYACDRWLNENNDFVSAEQLSDAMRITFTGNTTVMQKLYLTYGKKYTAAVKVRNITSGSMLLVQTINPYTTYIHFHLKNGINVFTFTANEATPNIMTRFALFGTASGDSVEVEWAALYEGEYTAETLPEYQPKGYGAELLECQRYYQIRYANNIAAVDMRPTMRLSSPTITSVSGGYAYSADL